MVKGHVDCRFNDIALDTAATNSDGSSILPDGTHKLFIRTDSFVDPASSILLQAPRRGRAVGSGPGVNGGTFSAITLYVFKARWGWGAGGARLQRPAPGGPLRGRQRPCPLNPSGPPHTQLPPPRPQVCNNPDPALCSTDATSTPDEQGPPPDVPPMNPPPGAAVYNGSQPLPPQTQAAEDPYNCAGWLGDRRYIESQAWHTRDGGDVAGASAQLHVGACLPHRGLVAGQVPLDIALTKSQWPTNANAAVAMRVSFFWKGGCVGFVWGGGVRREGAGGVSSVHNVGLASRSLRLPPALLSSPPGASPPPPATHPAPSRQQREL